MRFRRGIWYQVDGDQSSPEKYGATYAREDETGAVEVRKIQPTIEYVGEREAIEAGVPFWSREGYYDRERLTRCLNSFGTEESHNRGWHPIGYMGAKAADFNLRRRVDRFRLACAMLDYGEGAEEGPSGFSVDVLAGIGRCVSRKDWHAEDWKFRRMLKEAGGA